MRPWRGASKEAVGGSLRRRRWTPFDTSPTPATALLSTVRHGSSEPRAETVAGHGGHGPLSDHQDRDQEQV